MNKYILPAIAILLITYGCSAFIMMNTDPYSWSQDERLGFVAFTIFGELAYRLIYYLRATNQ